MRLKYFLSGALLWFCSLCAGEVYIIGTADLHGNTGGFAKLAPVFRRYPAAVKVDAGDLIQGNFAMTALRGMPMLEILNHLQYDIWVPGNHEFEFTGKDFCNWSNFFRGKILGAQWEFDGFKPAAWTVVQRGKYRIGIIGLSEERLAERTEFYPGFIWVNSEIALQKALDALERENCHALILVCHIAIRGSYGEIYRLLQKFPEIDAVISAHSHREHGGDMISDRLVCQPGARGESAVLLTLHFNDDELEYVHSRLLRPVDEIDPVVAAIAERAEHASRSAGMKNYGYYRNSGEFGMTAAEILRRRYGSDAAVVSFNEKYFRSRLNGWNLFRLFPFGNRLVSVEADLAQLRSWVSRFNASPRRCFLSVAPEIRNGRVKVVLSEFLYMQMTDVKHERGRILKDFERETIAEELEKSLSGSIL